MMEWIIPNSLLSNSPSRRDGLSEDLERTSRAKTTWFIEELGREFFKEAKSPARLCVSTACVLFHRFFAFQSFNQHDRFIIATASIFLATKIEESCIYRSRHLQTMASTYANVRKTLNAGLTEVDLKDIEKKILLAERILLQTLCFDLQITHPYMACFNKIKELKSYIAEDARKQFHQTAINFVNDSYRTTLCLQFTPEQIAIGAVFLAALYLDCTPETRGAGGGGGSSSSLSSSLEKTWFSLLETSIEEETLKSICEQMLSAYVYQEKQPGLLQMNAARASDIKGRLQTMGASDGSSVGGGGGKGGQETYGSPNSISNPPSFPYQQQQQQNSNNINKILAAASSSSTTTVSDSNTNHTDSNRDNNNGSKDDDKEIAASLTHSNIGKHPLDNDHNDDNNINVEASKRLRAE